MLNTPDRNLSMNPSISRSGNLNDWHKQSNRLASGAATYLLGRPGGCQSQESSQECMSCSTVASCFIFAAEAAFWRSRVCSSSRISSSTCGRMQWSLSSGHCPVASLLAGCNVHQHLAILIIAPPRSSDQHIHSTLCGKAVLRCRQPCLNLLRLQLFDQADNALILPAALLTCFTLALAFSALALA